MSDPKLRVGTNFCRCAACGEFFGGVGAFDLHRVDGENGRECLHPSAVVGKAGQPKLTMNDRGYWVRSFARKSHESRDSQP